MKGLSLSPLFLSFRVFRCSVLASCCSVGNSEEWTECVLQTLNSVLFDNSRSGDRADDNEELESFSQKPKTTPNFPSVSISRATAHARVSLSLSYKIYALSCPEFRVGGVASLLLSFLRGNAAFPTRLLLLLLPMKY